MTDDPTIKRQPQSFPSAGPPTPMQAEPAPQDPAHADPLDDDVEDADDDADNDSESGTETDAVPASDGDNS